MLIVLVCGLFTPVISLGIYYNAHFVHIPGKRQFLPVGGGTSHCVSESCLSSVQSKGA